MRAKQAPAKDIEEYIAGFPSNVQKILQEIGLTIREAAPGARRGQDCEVPSSEEPGIRKSETKEAIGARRARRGGCASKKKVRSIRSGADGVVVQVQKHFRLILIHHPVRSIKGSFAIFLLMSRPPLLARRGDDAVRL